MLGGEACPAHTKRSTHLEGYWNKTPVMSMCTSWGGGETPGSRRFREAWEAWARTVSGGVAVVAGLPPMLAPLGAPPAPQAGCRRGVGGWVGGVWLVALRVRFHESSMHLAQKDVRYFF